MTAVGEGSQVIQLKDHKFLLDEEKLKQILLREDVKGLPVVLVSVAGAFRGGKSFLLNFFLRYLKSPQSAREDGSWLGNDSEALQGFGWRGGSVRNTTGIQMWPEPFICDLPPGHKAGDKVAVFLMDTQGTFDNSSTVEECTKIFAIATLLSSIQIYNIKHNIQEDNLQHLHLFTEYGRMVKNQDNEAAFQVLEFLVRDWDFDWEHPYGYVGGQELLQSSLQITPGMSKELVEVRTHIRSCFEKVSCFLMPTPGRRVSRPDFTGNISEIETDFKDHLKVLVSSLFSPGKLEPKVMNGRVVTAQDLFTYFTSYMDAFSSGAIPATASIVMVTTKAGLLNAMRDELTQYEKNMDQECGQKAPNVPVIDVKELHERYKNSALNNFSTKRKMGTKEDAKPYYDQLSKDIEKRLDQYASINLVKYRDLADKAKKTYEDEINKIKNGGLFFVHAVDVEIIHKDATRTAVQVFDAGQKRITNKVDPARNDLVKSLNDNLTLLRTTNEANTAQIIETLTNEYRELMDTVTISDSILSEAELKKGHDENLAKILQRFNDKRNRQDKYTEDVHKTELIQAIEKRYRGIVDINKLANGKAIKAALSLYELDINTKWDQDKENLHPEELKQAHNTAVCLAINSLHPDNNDCRVNPNKDHETTLHNLLQSRYNGLLKLNTKKNNVAIEAGYRIFKEKQDALEKPSWWWLLVVPMIIEGAKTLGGKYFKEAREEGIEEFYKPRRNRGPIETDIYLEQFNEKIIGHHPVMVIPTFIKKAQEMRDRNKKQ